MLTNGNNRTIRKVSTTGQDSRIGRHIDSSSGVSANPKNPTNKGMVYSYKIDEGFDGDDRSIHRIEDIIRSRSNINSNGYPIIKKNFKIRIVKCS